MALLKFLKGNYSNLSNAAIAEGQILVCGDTGEMFVDVAADKRVKIGDFITVANLAALEALDATSVPTSRLYYVEDGNILARSNGTTWVQVNKQPTIAELKVQLGLGDLAYISEVSEDNLNSALKEKVNAAAEGNHAHLNKDELDKIADGDVEKWGTAYTHSQADHAPADAQANIIESVKVNGTALTITDKAVDITVPTGALAGKDEVTKDDLAEDLATEIDNKVVKEDGKSLVADTEITKLAGVSEGANKVEASENGKIKIDGVETVVYTHPDKHAIADVDGLQDAIDTLAKTHSDDKTELTNAINGKVASVTAGDGSITVGGTATAPTVAAKISADADNALTLADDGLKVVIPTAAEYSIVKAEDSGDYAAIYNLTKDGTIVGASINIPKDIVVKSGSVVNDEIILVLNDEAATEIKIPVGSLIEYVTSGSATGDMIVVNISDDHKVTATITDGTVTLAKLDTDTQTKINKAHSHENAGVLDGITADKVEAWDAAEQNAKDYADGLDEAMDARVQSLEAIDHEAYKAADTELATAIKTDVANQDAVVLAEAQKYTDTAKAEAIADAEGKVNTLAGNVYTKEQTYTQDEVDSAIETAVTNAYSWGEF